MTDETIVPLSEKVFNAHIQPSNTPSCVLCEQVFKKNDVVEAVEGYKKEVELFCDNNLHITHYDKMIILGCFERWFGVKK